MKAVIITPYFHPRVGGLELYASHMATELQRQGWEVHIITSGPTHQTTSRQGLTIHYLVPWFTLSNTPFSPWWPRQIRHLLAQIQPDIINAHAPVPTLALAAQNVVGRTPFVVTYHAGSMKKGRPHLDALIWLYEKFLLPRLLNQATAVVCASDFVRNGFLKKWAHKSTVIPPGVDCEQFHPTLKPASTKQILFVGDFRDPRKGLPYLTQALKHLPEASLRVVGPGVPTAQPRVSYVGILQNHELIRQFQASSLLVLPSTTEAESFGMVLIEAMACGLPVIGSQIGGIPSVIEHLTDGLLVPPRNSTQLRDAIASLLDNPALARRLGDNGRAKVLGQYQWSHQTAKYITLLKSLTAAAPSRGDAQ